MSEPPAALPAAAATVRRTRRTAIAWIPAIAYMALIFWLSAQANPLPELSVRFWDKGLHFVEYGALGALLALPLHVRGLRLGAVLLGAAAAASLYGATDELHQWFVPGRDADVLDWVADTLGGAMGAGLASAGLRLLEARASMRRVRLRS